LSHLHPGHCYAEAVTGEFKVIKGPGEYELKGVFITGIATWHDDAKGEKLGKNTVYVLEMDGITLCHLGDLGHLPTSELIEDMGDIDVLFLPVGGVSTIGGSTAAEIVRRLTPKVVIPMHYKTAALAKELEPADKFLKEVGVKEQISQPKLSVTRSTMPISTQVVILDYPH
jgi:L-ascorbate metabolism protein UlaG (beta-lactamase superfamily)